MAVYRGVVTITHPALGGTGTNTWHARSTDPFTGTADADLHGLNESLRAYYALLTAVVAGGTIFAQDGSFVRIDDDSGDFAMVDPWSVTTGTSQPPLPPADALVVSWRTAQAGKRARGRTFVSPCAANTLQDNGTPTESARATMDAAAASFVDSFDGIENGAWAIWSTVDHVARDIVSGSTANRFSVLRSRRD